GHFRQARHTPGGHGFGLRLPAGFSPGDAGGLGGHEFRIRQGGTEPEHQTRRQAEEGPRREAVFERVKLRVESTTMTGGRSDRWLARCSHGSVPFLKRGENRKPRDDHSLLAAELDPLRACSSGPCPARWVTVLGWAGGKRSPEVSRSSPSVPS